MTPQEAIEVRIANKIKNNPDIATNINALYRIELSGAQGGVWMVDTREGSLGVRKADEEGQCAILMADSNFLDLVEGKLNPQMAFMTGKLKVKGNMALALKLGQLLKD